MAVTTGNSSTDLQTISASNHSFSHNNNGDVLYVAIAFDNADVTTFTDVQYNSVSLTQVAIIETGRSIYVYRLINPTAGSNTVFVDYDGTQNNVNYIAVSLSGVHQTTPETGSSTSGGSGTSISIPTITSTASDLVLGFGYLNNEAIGDVTEGSGQTLINSAGINGVIWASEKAGASSSQSLAWTVTSQSYGAIGISVAASSSVSVTPTNATPNDGDLQEMTFVGATGPIIAATEAGKDIFPDLSGTDPSVKITFTSDVSLLAASETSEGASRIGKDSTLSFTTAVDGAITTTINKQPKTGWAVEDLAATLVKGVDDYLTLVDAKHSITTAVGNQNYYKQLYGESITAQGVYTGGTLVPFQFTEYVIQQGGSATTTATSYGEKFYPFGEAASGGGAAVKSINLSSIRIGL